MIKLQVPSNYSELLARLSPIVGDEDAKESDITAGAEDENQNGKLDSCELLYGDLNLDGHIDGADLGGLLALWGITNPPYGDLDGNQRIDGADLGKLLSHWGIVN